MKNGFLGYFGDEVEALPYLEAKINSLDQQLNRMRKINYMTTNTGFVTFDNVSSAVQCAQVCRWMIRNLNRDFGGKY